MLRVYNRYIRNESGAYARVPQQEAPSAPSPPPPKPPQEPQQPQPPSPPPKHGACRAPEADFLNRILAMFHLGDLDSGDLLVLLLLFLLFREGADEELLIALGLLLIL